MKKVTPSNIKLIETDLAFSIDLPNRNRQKVRCLSILKCYENGTLPELIEMMRTAGLNGRPIDLYFDVTEENKIVGIELLR
jgi:hypothetical protein